MWIQDSGSNDQHTTGNSTGNIFQSVLLETSKNSQHLNEIKMQGSIACNTQTIFLKHLLQKPFNNMQYGLPPKGGCLPVA